MTTEVKVKKIAARPQLVYSARQMFETRLVKYNDPHNLEWDFDDITDKWERHAWSAFLDLQSTEAERDTLLNEVRNATERFEAEHELLRKVVGERNGLRDEVAQMRKALETLCTRLEKTTENGPDCECPAEGHMCGWPHLQREVDRARALMGKVR